MQPMRAAFAVRGAGAAVLALGLALALVAPATAHADAAGERMLIPSASWHGRPIQEPHRHEAVRTSLADVPRRWSAGAVAIGTGFHRPGGSVRVREVQLRLRRLGYRPGPIDGLFGPRTRASVAWFQVKHGLPVTGRATLATVRHLRKRTGAGFGRGTTAPAEEQIGAQARAQPAPPSQVERMVATQGDSPVGGEWIALLALLMFALGFAAVAIPRRLRRSASAAGPQPLKQAMLGDATVPPAPHRSRVLAYVLIPAEAADDAGYRDHAAAIEAECAEQGLALAGLISDVEDARLAWQRPGLATAVDRFVDGDVEFLMVTRLEDPATSEEDLRDLVTVTENEIAIARWKRDPTRGPQPEREHSDA